MPDPPASALFADPQCPSALVQLTATECRGRTVRYLSSCPSDGVTEPRSCVELMLTDVASGQSGEGTYYDHDGVLFNVVIDEVAPSLSDSSLETIRSGTMRGTFSRSGGDGSSQPFELTFSACSQPRTACLL